MVNKMIPIVEAYDPFKKDMKKSKTGRYGDGWGNSYEVGRDVSDKISYNGFDFQYDYKNGLLKILDPKTGEELDATGLSVGNWLDNPDYWIERYSEFTER